MTQTAVIKDSKIVKSSRNLRGMLDYARVSPVSSVITMRNKDLPVRGDLHIEYQNGAYCMVSFTSYHIMIDFVRNRRSWRAANIKHHAEAIGYLTKPGLIVDSFTLKAES